MQLTDEDKEMIRERVAAMKRRWFPEAFPLKGSTISVLEIIERFWAECLLETSHWAFWDAVGPMPDPLPEFKLPDLKGTVPNWSQWKV